MAHYDFELIWFSDDDDLQYFVNIYSPSEYIL